MFKLMAGFAIHSVTIEYLLEIFVLMRIKLFLTLALWNSKVFLERQKEYIYIEVHKDRKEKKIENPFSTFI